MRRGRERRGRERERRERDVNFFPDVTLLTTLTVVFVW